MLSVGLQKGQLAHKKPVPLIYYYYYMRLTTFFPGQPGTRHDGVAVTSAGQHANHLHLTPDKITTPVPHLSLYRPDALPAAKPTALKH